MPNGVRLTPPDILQIYRERLKPGSDAAYAALEEEQARISVECDCPHPYLGAESLTGPKEVWWFNGYSSPVDQQQVYAAYAGNTPLLTALQENSIKKQDLTFSPSEVFAHYREDLSAGMPWAPGQGRFLVITVTTREPAIEGTVFQAPDGTRFIVQSARTRVEAEAVKETAGDEACILAVRPSWSFPDQAWIADDPDFWQA